VDADLCHLRRARDLIDREFARPLDVPAMARAAAIDEATRQAAEELRAAGCQALDELRDLVGILRTGPEHPAPDEDQTPATPDFAALIAESTAVGTPAELVEDGDPALASPVVGRTVYRIVREALTNVRKHAPPGAVRRRDRRSGCRRRTSRRWPGRRGAAGAGPSAAAAGRSAGPR